MSRIREARLVDSCTAGQLRVARHGAGTVDAAEIFAEHGIVARALGEVLRVSVGERESVEKLLRAAANVVAIQPTQPPGSR